MFDNVLGIVTVAVVFIRLTLTFNYFLPYKVVMVLLVLAGHAERWVSPSNICHFNSIFS